MPMREYVTTGAPRSAADRTRVSAAGFVRGADARCSRMHSGQITPTGAWVWHSGQIVRPHRWQSDEALPIGMPVAEVRSLGAGVGHLGVRPARS